MLKNFKYIFRVVVLAFSFLSLDSGAMADSVKLEDWTQDAYYHALSSYVATIRFGEEFAKDLGDTNERENPKPKGVQLMNLYNNAVGRELARDKHNHLRKPEDVIDDALKNDLLKTEPFIVKDEGK